MDALTAFATLDVRVGTIQTVQRLVNIRKAAYKLSIDFGEAIGRKQSVVQITDLYSEAELMGKQVLAVVNLPPKRIGPFTSEVLVLGVPDEAEKVVLVVPERPTANGVKLF